MPIQGPKQEDLKLVINPVSVENIGIEIPSELMEQATLTTEQSE